MATGVVDCARATLAAARPPTNVAAVNSIKWLRSFTGVIFI
jgi:hypothetical protein